jgi:phage tail sheath protein FI
MKKNLLLVTVFFILAMSAYAQVKLQPVAVPAKKIKVIPPFQKDSIIAAINDIMDGFAGKPNNCDTWPDVRSQIFNYLAVKWHKGILQGDKPESAFFVRVGKDTMTQLDFQQNRLVVVVGFALRRPAEFETASFAKQL